MARNKIIIEVCEESDDGMKIAIKLHGIPFESLQAKFAKGVKMSQIEVAAHFMCTKFLEFHQHRALLTTQNKDLAKKLARRN